MAASVTYDGLDHAAVQMLVDHIDGSGVRAHFEIAPDGHTFVYVELVNGAQVMLWPGCVVSRDEENQITVHGGHSHLGTCQVCLARDADRECEHGKPVCAAHAAHDVGECTAEPTE